MDERKEKHKLLFNINIWHWCPCRWKNNCAEKLSNHKINERINKTKAIKLAYKHTLIKQEWLTNSSRWDANSYGASFVFSPFRCVNTIYWGQFAWDGNHGEEEKKNYEIFKSANICTKATCSAPHLIDQRRLIVFFRRIFHKEKVFFFLVHSQETSNLKNPRIWKKNRSASWDEKKTFSSHRSLFKFIGKSEILIYIHTHTYDPKKKPEKKRNQKWNQILFWFYFWTKLTQIFSFKMKIIK